MDNKGERDDLLNTNGVFLEILVYLRRNFCYCIGFKFYPKKKKRS